MNGEDDIKFMRRCLDLASGAEGLTYPNPMVGSVVVWNGRIIGEGYHVMAGGPHAEVIAINEVKDKIKLKESVLYVTLEPCSHFGRTPPCADYIIENSIPRVVIGTIDPNDKVSGRGLAKLREAGCMVTTGVCEEECRHLNRRFFTFHEKRRPYITLKWAQSADGYIDMVRAEHQVPNPNWITGKPERSLVHKWRSEEQAILVGAGTVRADDPRLNVRDWTGTDPLRLILSRSARIDAGSSMLKQEGKTIVFTASSEAEIPGAEIILINNRKDAGSQIADYLFSSGIQSLFIEGGAMVLRHFIDLGLWDESRIFKGREFFGRGVPAPVMYGKLISKTEFSSSILEIYRNSVDHKVDY